MKRRVILFLATFVVLLCDAAFMGDRALRHKGHPGLKKFLHQWWVNYPASFQVEPEEVALKVDQADMDAIQGVVDHASFPRGINDPLYGVHISLVHLPRPLLRLHL
ncbi:MAG TPA: hypothetical protein PKJ19_12825, partial [Flavobacteriales bacterium]|nr:hypothetical protein [Flavobacteriales bacterium]